MFRYTETSPFNYADYFASAAQLLVEYRWIFCYNNTKFIRSGVLEQLPQEWINDLDTASNEEFNQIPLGFVKDTWCDSFKEFLLQVKKLQVQYDPHGSALPKDNRPKAARKGINAKKAYEIDNLCNFIESVQRPAEATLYIDFGSGLGYLSELIHKQCGAKVLGIEGNPTLVETCNNRFPDPTKKSVQYCHHFITETSFTFMQHECSARFGPELAQKAAVVGLHACADLSITAINCFLHCRWAKSLTIMPCCYHRMKPIDETAPNVFVNFPLSQELRATLSDDRSRRIICRSFLRLGCQQTSARWKGRTVEQHLEHGRIMFRRGLIDAVLEQTESVRVGKLKLISEETTVDNMLEQFQLLKQLDNDSRECLWTEQHRDRLSALLEKYGTFSGPKLAEYVECLQTCLQSICENVILLDRMCYMESIAKQVGIQIRRNLVKLREDGLSPRCFIVYASKY
ncbi:methyltransferase-like protein 25B [Anopheles maculipalpis]|uniref:methyltransferase-like protein 25B n=1 Tax=Anopheles maculipalpis TaxID=1496333 RepID=UPI002158C0EE|nr:methyltransferase-like protein 25B [Anopheles maculipalpis]